MSTIDQNLADLGAIVGAEVVAAERSPWGFENRTDIVTLAHGRQLVVQRLMNRALVEHKLRLGRMIPERLAVLGIAMPRQLHADPHADPPYAVREYLAGAAGATRMGSVDGAVAVAQAMGALLPRIRTLSTNGLGLNHTWTDPVRLARQARQQLERCRALISAPDAAALHATISAAPAALDASVRCFAHGDFCPVNVLIETNELQDKATRRQGDEETQMRAYDSSPLLPVSSTPLLEVVALLDVEFARIATPLFDLAWWGWVVRYHHEERWRAAWPVLLAAADVANDAATAAQVTLIQRLRCLEALDYNATFAPNAAPMWAERLHTTLEWDAAL